MTDHLQGPWAAVIADRDGFVYNSVDDVRENAEDPEDEYTIAVVRGSAVPTDRNGTTGCRLRLPGSAFCGDKAYEIENIYLDGDGDETTGLEARWAQAQAMAAGLNAAGGAR